MPELPQSVREKLGSASLEHFDSLDEGGQRDFIARLLSKSQDPEQLGPRISARSPDLVGPKGRIPPEGRNIAPPVESEAARNARMALNVVGVAAGGLAAGLPRAARLASGLMRSSRNLPISQRAAELGAAQAGVQGPEALAASMRLIAGQAGGGLAGQSAADLLILSRTARGQMVSEDDLPPSMSALFQRNQIDLAMEAVFPGAAAFSKAAQRVMFKMLARIPADRALVAERAFAEGVAPGMGEFSNLPGVSMFRNTLGKFPLVNPVTRRFEAKRFGQIEDFKDRLLQTISPRNIGRSNASRAMVGRAPLTRAILASEEGRRWELFRQAALRTNALIPTVNVRNHAATELDGLSGIAKRPTMDVLHERADGTFEIVKQAIPPALVGRARTMLGKLSQLSPSQNFEQWQNLMTDLNDFQTLSRRLLGAGRELRLFQGVKMQMEAALGQIAVPGRGGVLGSPSLGQAEVVELLTDARSFTRESRQILETATARRFEQGVRRLLSPGLEQEVRAPDEMFDVVFKAASADSIAQLRTLLRGSNLPDPDKLFKNAVRAHISETFEAAFETKESTRFFNLRKLSKDLGLDNPASAEFGGLREMLKGTGISTGDLQQFMETARNAFPERQINVSDFLGRRTVLSGARGLISGFVPTMTGGAGLAAGGVGAGAMSALAGGILFFWGSRQGAKFVANPAFLKTAIRAIDPDIPLSQRRALFARMGRITGGEFTDFFVDLEGAMREVNAQRPEGLEPIFSGERNEGRGTRTNEQRRRQGRQRRSESRSSQRSQSSPTPRPGRGFNRPVNPGPPRTGERTTGGAALPPSSPLAGTL